MIVLEAAEWRVREAVHAERADALTAGHRVRRSRGEAHPIEDFLFTYYAYSPGFLRRWHPGAGVELLDAAGEERAGWRWYMSGEAYDSLAVDATAFRTEKGSLLTAVERLLAATARRPPAFGCFGLHEWAMVYRQPEHRHPVPLRLGQDGTDAVVEASELRCTHFDAFRFFTPEAVPRNAATPTRENQPELEQPGCLHANMDLYKWAVKLGPLVPGELLLDCFELARDIRTLDMAASPYDVSAWGVPAVPIETAAGKSEYGRRQRGFAARAAALRDRLLAAASPTPVAAVSPMPLAAASPTPVAAAVPA